MTAPADGVIGLDDATLVGLPPKPNMILGNLFDLQTGRRDHGPGGLRLPA
jgi:hypothetical protein